MLGSGVGQYRVKSDGSCAPHGEDGAFRQRRDMQEQCAMAAMACTREPNCSNAQGWVEFQEPYLITDVHAMKLASKREPNCSFATRFRSPLAVVGSLMKPFFVDRAGPFSLDSRVGLY